MTRLLVIPMSMLFKVKYLNKLIDVIMEPAIINGVNTIGIKIALLRVKNDPNIIT